MFKALRKSGVKLAVVSNFDTRLRPLLRALNCDDWFDAVAVSAEVSKLLFFPFIFHILFYQSVLRTCDWLSASPPRPLMHAIYCIDVIHDTKNLWKEMVEIYFESFVVSSHILQKHVRN